MSDSFLLVRAKITSPGTSTSMKAYREQQRQETPSPLPQYARRRSAQIRQKVAILASSPLRPWGTVKQALQLPPPLPLPRRIPPARISTHTEHVVFRGLGRGRAENTDESDGTLNEIYEAEERVKSISSISGFSSSSLSVRVSSCIRYSMKSTVVLPRDGILVYDSGQDPDFMLHSGDNEQDSEDSYEADYVGEKGVPPRKEDFEDDAESAAEYVCISIGNGDGGRRGRNSPLFFTTPVLGSRQSDTVEGRDLDMLQRFENDADADDLVLVLDKDIPGFDVGNIDNWKVSGRQQKMIGERNLSPKKCPKNFKKRSLYRNMHVTERQEGDQSIQELCLQAVQRLREPFPEFFTSNEASIEKEDAVRKGKRAHSSVLISQCENCDVQSIFVTEYDRKVKHGESYRSYLQLVTVAGQYLRLCVVCGLTTGGKL